MRNLFLFVMRNLFLLVMRNLFFFLVMRNFFFNYENFFLFLVMRKCFWIVIITTFIFNDSSCSRTLENVRTLIGIIIISGYAIFFGIVKILILIIKKKTFCRKSEIVITIRVLEFF